jgi:hypothetical protein
MLREVDFKSHQHYYKLDLKAYIESEKWFHQKLFFLWKHWTLFFSIIYWNHYNKKVAVDQPKALSSEHNNLHSTS